MKQITLNTKDIKNTYSASGTIIDELAYASGQWTEEDLRNNNYDYEYESFDYINEHFNFEDALLKATKQATDLLEIASKLNVYLVPNDEMMKENELQAGASCALNMSDKWTELLKAYENKCKEEQYQFDDSNFLSKYAPDYVKELREGDDSFWEDLTNEWLYGGHERDNNGILCEIKKYFGAEDIQFDEKNWDNITLEFDEDELHEQYCGCGDDKCKEKPDYKKDILAHIQSASEGRHNKEKAERAKRSEERAKTKEYQDRRKAEAEAERKVKLLALKK